MIHYLLQTAFQKLFQFTVSINTAQQFQQKLKWSNQLLHNFIYQLAYYCFIVHDLISFFFYDLISYLQFFP